MPMLRSKERQKRHFHYILDLDGDGSTLNLKGLSFLCLTPPQKGICTILRCWIGIDSLSFEIHPWSSVEFEAINLFVKTLPQYRIRSHLGRAMGSLESHYYGRTTAVETPTGVGQQAERMSNQYGSTTLHRRRFWSILLSNLNIPDIPWPFDP